VIVVVVKGLVDVRVVLLVLWAQHFVGVMKVVMVSHLLTDHGLRIFRPGNIDAIQGFFSPGRGYSGCHRRRQRRGASLFHVQVPYFTATLSRYFESRRGILVHASCCIVFVVVVVVVVFVLLASLGFVPIR